MLEQPNKAVPYKPGDRVVIATDEAKAQVGADHGVVVGDTCAQCGADEPKVVVALNKPIVPNAVVSPADLEPDPARFD